MFTYVPQDTAMMNGWKRLWKVEKHRCEIQKTQSQLIDREIAVFFAKPFTALK